MKRRTAAFFLVICILLSSFATPRAAGIVDELIQLENPMRYTGINVISATLAINGNGNASCNGYVAAKKGYTCTATLFLQKYDNSQWVTIDYWPHSEAKTISIVHSVDVDSGFNYRLFLDVYVYKNGVYVETANVTSSTSYY